MSRISGISEKVAGLPHTLNPDMLAQSPEKPSIEGMTDKKVLTDGNHVVELYRLKDSTHNDGLHRYGLRGGGACESRRQRRSIIGPSLVNLDFSVYKNFAVYTDSTEQRAFASKFYAV